MSVRPPANFLKEPPQICGPSFIPGSGGERNVAVNGSASVKVASNRRTIAKMAHNFASLVEQELGLDHDLM
jgi:hypothetical protein